MFNHLLSIWNFLLESAPLFSAVGMIIITYSVYHLSKKDTNRDHYLRYIVDLYYRIEDDYERLRFGCENDSDTSSSVYLQNQKQYKRRISVNCILMRDYIKRFPGYYPNRKQIMDVLYEMSTNPTQSDNYDKLAIEFKLFCLLVRKSKRDFNTIQLDNTQAVDD